ncbi:barttin [Eublepharis macularius]|uniref:Barttin n=1 Tax=Eublepharis macularius TaxID=481883 RepID=A0AA97L0B3_EUBMA|nr:barttin [Eublepharis macularius]
MAEEKTFRHGLIVLGFFLVMIGMFIMSVDKPQIYITFCTLGILVIAVGITWSMCQCYPKIRVVSVDTELEKFLAKSPAASSVENEILGKNSSSTTYTTQKEAEIYEKSLPSYEQVQMNKAGAAECLGVQTTSDLSVSPVGDVQLVVQAKAEVHRDSGSNGGIHKDAESQKNLTRLFCQSEAPLASFQEDVETSSVKSTSNSPFLQRYKDTPNLCSPPEIQLIFKLPSYEDFALIDSLMGDSQSNEKIVEPSKIHQSVPATAREEALPMDLGAELLESKFIPSVEVGDLYYGIYEGPEDIFVSVDAAFEPKDLLNTKTGESDN